jgi:hypothetical protein
LNIGQHHTIMGNGVSAKLIPEYRELGDLEKMNIERKYTELRQRGWNEVDTITQLRKAHDNDPRQWARTPPAAFPDAPAVTNGIQVVPLSGLLGTIEEAIGNGRTPLIVDNSEDDKVNTYFSYRSTVMLDGKKMGLDKVLNNIPISDIMVGARAKLVRAIKFRYPLVIALTKSVTDFKTTFTDEACRKMENHQGMDFKSGKKSYFPLNVFINGGKGMLKESALNALFTEEDKKEALSVSEYRDDEAFVVIITTQFSPADFEDYLFAGPQGLPGPKCWYQFIVVKSEE